VGSLGHQNQPAVGRFGPLGQQINLNHRGNIGIERNPPFSLTLADYLQPPAADIDLGDV